VIDRTMVTSRMLDIGFSDLHQPLLPVTGGTDDVHGMSSLLHGTATA
jgi:hypothetical protein